ncbi:hypothetical protein FV232_24570 [Methylobacterium sp. WL30]|nr:MAG: hypothetical protein EOO77_01390 [Oxalobacteraceae bacterium]TXN20498.1 hypothetical protein FV225_27500 [Methylobacterium sp. WL93]TXN49853.1 hypothetical protein FV227_14810 [Methylobacterium sp. WL119]TXN62867.1 hypothetical protein FV232_24570 [Methylobacterium sp. WL30]
MDDPTPLAVTVEPCQESSKDFRWHLTDANGVSVRVSPEAYPTRENASEAGRAALSAFGAAI